MKTKVVILVLALALMVMPIAACSQTKPAIEPIKIGVMLDQTSWGSLTDLLSISGYKFAAAEVGTINGRPIELVFEDTGYNPSQAIDKARKLVERDNIVLSLGPALPAEVEAVAPYLTKNKVPIIPQYPKPASSLKQEDWVVFPLGTNPMFGYASGVFAAEELGAKTATTAGLDFAGPHDYVAGFTQAFEERGGKVIQNQWFAGDVVDFSTYILNMKDADVAAVVVFGTLDVPFYKQYRELVEPGKRPVVCLWDEFDMAANQQLLNGPAEIPTYSASALTYKNPQTREDFLARYLERYASAAAESTPFQLGYYIGSIGLQALRMTGGEGGDDLWKALETMDWESIKGRVKFTDKMMDTIVQMVALESGTDHYELVPAKQYRIHGEWNADRTAIIKSVVK
jgi:branched-chain amino acid transport system substrate-binding protein